MRNRRIRRYRPAGDPARRAREARIPRLRLRRHLRSRASRGSRPCARSATSPTCARRSTSATARTAASRCSRRPPRPASATRAGRRTAASREENAHPHFDTDDRVHVVVNGIVENYIELKQELLADGAVFTSETDAEVIAHLISQHLEGDGLVEAVRGRLRAAARPLRLRRVAADEPGVIVAARKECPLVVGRGDGEQFLASAIPAFLAHTRRVQLIENDEIVVVHRRRRPLPDAPTARRVERAIEEVDWSAEVAEKGGYETFMLKEIHEQADAVAETIADRTARGDGVDLGDLGAIDDEFLRTCRRVVDRRLRHLLPRRPDRPLRDRGVGAARRRDGHRVRVPLPQPGGRPGRPRRSASRSRARRRTRWPRCASRASAARRCSRSRT